MSRQVIGIDVQAARDCPYAVVDQSASVVEGGWIPRTALAANVSALADRFREATFAIDAPRMPLKRRRVWYWRSGAWGPASDKEKGCGRHCEVVIAVNHLANPQWTPVERDAPPWMRNGFEIFNALRGRAETLEVFPSASYNMLRSATDTTVNLSFAGFHAGPKDMLDAVVAALTGLEYLAGRGQEVGGGDGLGTIVLPRRIEVPILEVMRWPEG